MEPTIDLAEARESVLAHARSSRNGVFPHRVTSAASLTHYSCDYLGDLVELRALVRGGRVVDIGYASRACAVCTASAALLCLTVRHRPVDEVLRMADRFEDELRLAPPHPWPSSLKMLSCFALLRRSPARGACAALPWILLKTVLR